MSTPSGAAPKVPISWGELIDKVTILEIKSERLDAGESLANVRRELSLLQKFAEPVLAEGGEIANLKSQLRATNQRLWDVETLLRQKETAGEFGPVFIELARSVYRSNDERAAIKKTINLLLASEIVEEKSYHPSTGPE